MQNRNKVYNKNLKQKYKCIYNVVGGQQSYCNCKYLLIYKGC